MTSPWTRRARLSTRPVIIAGHERNNTVGTFQRFELHDRPVSSHRERTTGTVYRRPFYFASAPCIHHPPIMIRTCHCAVVALSLYAMLSAAAGCKYTVDSYTTTDAMIVTEAAFIAQVSVADCEDPPSNLYAEVEGKLVVAANAGPNKYQVSWLDDFKKARRGDYNVKLYDEAGYGQLRKLLRDGESISSVTPVHSAYVRYSGAYRGVWVNSEFLAAIVSLVVLYFAYTFKSKIVS